MKRQSILFVRSMCVVILFITLAACKDTDNRVFGDDFDFPALTDDSLYSKCCRRLAAIGHCGKWRTNGDRLGKRSYTENRRPFFNDWRSGI